MLLRRFLGNHVLANLTFLLVLAMGVTSYMMLPRQQDPTINFNWFDIFVVLPGASAEDMERRVTDPIERKIRNVADIDFVSSTSREGVANILVRFDDIDSQTFLARAADLRREIRAAEDELPDEAEDPVVREITTANAFPLATIVVTSPDGGEQLRRQAEIVQRDMEQISGIDELIPIGKQTPELQIAFDPVAVESYGLTPDALADTVRGYMRDLSAGRVSVGTESWLIRVTGTTPDPEVVGMLPVTTAHGEVPLDFLATVQRGRSKAESVVRYEGAPAILYGITKDANAHTLDLMARVSDYIDDWNVTSDQTGATIVLADDQTPVMRSALSVMQSNMLIGLFLVLIVTCAFLGVRMSLLTATAVPFILAGTFWVISGFDQTLNTVVLLAVVIALGMIVDATVVVVEAIYYRLERGQSTMDATVNGLREVFAPVTASVATTVAAFLPLMLLPGILGQFMFIVPLVVTVALSLSLVAAYWMLPAQINAFGITLSRPSRAQRFRTRMLRRIRNVYTRLLARVIRRPVIMLTTTLLLFVITVAAVVSETGIRRDFFAFDPIRLFYVNIEMPVGTPLAVSERVALDVEREIRAGMRDEEVRSTVAYVGRQRTDTELRYGDRYGQIMVALQPHSRGMREVGEIVDDLRARMDQKLGAQNISFLQIAGGPPTTRPIDVKVRGDDFDDIRAAVADIRAYMEGVPEITDVMDDDDSGQMVLSLRIDAEAAHRAGIPPEQVSRVIRLLVDGEVVTAFQDQGEEREVRVMAQRSPLTDVDAVLDTSLTGANGERVPLADLVHAERGPGMVSINHYNFRRTISVQADIDREVTDVVAANDRIRAHWEEIRDRHPNISLDFSGLLDDIEESLDAMVILFLFGLGLMYLILGTQFRSYFQPFAILVAVPLAFTGVVAGLMVTGNPLSLYTLFGTVALAGIAVNASIVMLSAANERLQNGMPLAHATLFAARRRVIPILITSTTTVAGLFSLATGLGGRSLLWGPVATAIVWGLVVSTVLTLFVVPTLYWWAMRARYR